MKSVCEIGNRYGRLLVVEGVKRDKSGPALWKCVCDCGSTHVVAGTVLRKGASKSCGCLQKELASKRAKAQVSPTLKHGFAKAKNVNSTYSIWQGIKWRCSNAEDSRYCGRGITVCDRWRESFENFLADMGARPSPKHSIDRIDVNGNYEPDNCRWATSLEQQNNKRSNHKFLFKGERLSIAEIARRANVKYGFAQYYLKKYGSEKFTELVSSSTTC